MEYTQKSVSWWIEMCGVIVVLKFRFDRFVFVLQLFFVSTCFLFFWFCLLNFNKTNHQNTRTKSTRTKIRTETKNREHCRLQCSAVEHHSAWTERTYDFATFFLFHLIRLSIRTPLNKVDGADTIKVKSMSYQPHCLLELGRI